MNNLWGRFSGIIAWLTLCAGSYLAQATVGSAPDVKSRVSIHAIQRVAGTYFYLRSNFAGAHEVLMVRKRPATTGRRLLDLQTLAPGNPSPKFEIQPSWDGKYVAIGISLGREGYAIRVLNVATGKLLPDSIARSFDGDASWSDSNNAFFYRKFQQLPDKPSPAAVFTNMRAYLHKLGDDASLDTPVFGPDINPELRLPIVGAVNAFPLPGTSLLLGVQSSAPTELDSFWVHDTHEEGRPWRKIIDHADEALFEFSSRGTVLYFITRRNTPNGQLMSFDAAHEDISGARKILPASDVEFADRNRDGMLCAKDALYVYGHRKDRSVLLRVPYDDPTRSMEILLPFPGVIADVSGDSHTPGLSFSLAGDTHPLAVYEYDPSRNRIEDTLLTQ